MHAVVDRQVGHLRRRVCRSRTCREPLVLLLFLLFCTNARWTLRMRRMRSVWRVTAPVKLLVGILLRAKHEATYDRRLSPSFFLSSMTFNICLRPSRALMCASFMLMLIFLLASAFNSLFSRRCFISTQTKTPQSLPFSCCGESCMGIKRSLFPSSCSIFMVVLRASRSLLADIES